MPITEPWRCPFCGIGVPVGCTHACPSASALPFMPVAQPVGGGLIPLPPTREEVQQMIPKGLTEEDVRRIVREEMAVASESKEQRDA